jgi:hypothetical protein
MRKFLIIAAFVIAASPLAAHAQEKSEAKATGSPVIMASARTTETLKILAIDKATRVVTLKSEDGDTIAVKCGPEVRNFGQLAVGDEVKTTYSESYSIHVEKEGEAEEVNEVATSRAALGAKPGASVYETKIIKAKIDAIDKTKGTVTLATMTGEKFTVTAKNKANLDKVEVGNTVVVTARTGSVISVNKPGAAKSASTSKKK